MPSKTVNATSPEDNWSSVEPIGSKFDPFATEGSLVASTDVKQELSSEGQDEPPLTQNNIELPSWPASTEVDQPRPVRHTGLRDALSHLEEAALSSESAEDRPIQSQSNEASPSGKGVSPVRAKTDFENYGRVFHRSPNYARRPRPPPSQEPIRQPFVFRRRPLLSQTPQTPPPQPERTPTPPYQYASVQRARVIRLMVEKFGPDWVPVEREYDDGEGDNKESDSDSEEEEDGSSLIPADPNDVRGFFDMLLQLRGAARVERGEAPRSNSPAAQSPRNTYSREELVELGVPTVRLVTNQIEPDVPLPFQ